MMILKRNLKSDWEDFCLYLRQKIYKKRYCVAPIEVLIKSDNDILKKSKEETPMDFGYIWTSATLIY